MQDEALPATREIATLGGGCFWCLEAVFIELKGVLEVVSGYMGGRTPDPSYEQVCSGRSGHAEVVRITFDPDVVSYADLLRVFFVIHDPTTLNRQGNDVGTQYRSVIFHHSPQQKAAADQVIEEMSRVGFYSAPIVTEVTPAGTFYSAEEYHQSYYARNPDQPYCRFVVEPKLAKFRRTFLERLKRAS
jgi:peptide-methionine (S)-S-oxide reductase